MSANHCICPVTIVIQEGIPSHVRGTRFGFTSKHLKACLQLVREEPANTTARGFLASSIETYLRRLVSHCALKVHVPAFADCAWQSPAEIKRLLAPSLRSHLVFVDNRKALWQAVWEFFSPVTETVSDTNPNVLSQLAWAFYLLVLAARYHGEAVISAKDFLRYAARVDRDASLSSEARARLARMCGVFRLFEPHGTVPSLRVRADAGPNAVTERIDEILEDAYLLDASSLRRFFGIRQNVASLKKDLRMLFSTVCRSRVWAKGLVDLSSTPLLGGDSAKRVLESLVQIIPALEPQSSQPVLIPMDINIHGCVEGTVRMVRDVSRNEWLYGFE